MFSCQVLCGGDIKRLSNATSHKVLMNLMFKLNLLNLTNFINMTLKKINVNLSILFLFLWEYHFQC
jgi:hypothetical protein